MSSFSFALQNPVWEVVKYLESVICRKRLRHFFWFGFSRKYFANEYFKSLFPEEFTLWTAFIAFQIIFPHPYWSYWDIVPRLWLLGTECQSMCNYLWYLATSVTSFSALHLPYNYTTHRVQLTMYIFLSLKCLCFTSERNHIFDKLNAFVNIDCLLDASIINWQYK